MQSTITLSVCQKAQGSRHLARLAAAEQARHAIQGLGEAFLHSTPLVGVTVSRGIGAVCSSAAVGSA